MSLAHAHCITTRCKILCKNIFFVYLNKLLIKSASDMHNSRRGLSLLCALNVKSPISQLNPTTTVLISKCVHRSSYQQARHKKNNNAANVSTLFKPVPVRHNTDELDVGAELVGKLDKSDILKILNKFTQRREIKLLSSENGLDSYLLQQAFASFRRYCIEADNLPVDLHIIFSDISQGAGHIDDIFPYFLRHAKTVFPHLDCMDDLKKISDLRTPANWYPSARAITRKIVFHAGPTNSGKTYHAMERFLTAKSGVYCGPLKLLATEVFNKCNERGTPCDLVTGEERKYGINENTPANHVACTVEMTSVNTPYEVAVIDEIQQLRDPQRGWAWTRAFLGLIADEVHVCGEAGALELLQKICETTNETVEVHNYNRLTQLTVEDSALVTLDNVMPGDCIVCFSKNDIYSVSRQIEARGKEVAVIYGGLPPGTKLAQAAKFNDPENSCKVMVATDAIGMGLNLSIRRIIFYSLVKPSMNEKGEREIDTISVSSALQIAGRAGRFRTQWEHGYVTTFKADDLPVLKKVLSQSPDPLKQAGLHPTADQIELYAYHLPNSTLSNLMDIFVNLSTVDDSLYFMCNIEDFKFLAEMIQHVPLPLRARYVFCCAPINKKMAFVCSMFLKIARQYSRNEPVTFEFITKNCGWPFSLPKTILDLVHLESVFDVMDLYLWLSYRFIDLFPDAPAVRIAQRELDEIIQQGVFQITRLLKNTEANQNASDGDTTYNMRRTTQFKEPRVPTNMRGRLTERLLAQGLLTPAMLSELRKEWDRQQHSLEERNFSNTFDDNEDDNEYNDSTHKKFRRKRRK
ncbi:ATP-dependent RNA helicase SUV3 homolog, mitochondrial [Teleopsis dalmanni]|uniref:ATP-dependent RNA helicase SUV3 homolog, mitochondrial-like n=1 Tax=Teleopsis dalmanni TaxID=139649 RepID=UPI0018CD56B5|nr:ATP-dependent RNA helicase SUV3 homolog, mitochondrial-like [Teleopsis dalmanni]XP_037946897.1 ATP-dependent RNA helicase SUV3 homolog, mitochondrial [Teleopsis dalmanni]